MSRITPELVRVGDKEREAAAARLSAHAAAGRLRMDELEERLERADRAVFAADLAALEADLPGPPERRRPALPLRAFALAWLVAAVVVTVMVGHPIAPMFLVAFLLLRAGHRRPWARVAR
jgi:hypothetical protein